MIVDSSVLFINTRVGIESMYYYRCMEYSSARALRATEYVDISYP